MKIVITAIIAIIMFLCNPNIHFPVKGLFPGTRLILRLNGLNRQDKISFGAMLSPNIPSLTVLLERGTDKLQSFTRFLRYTLVIREKNSEIRESFNFYFSAVFY